MGAPGVTFETVDLTRPRVGRVRTDICGFVGYAERGPLDQPVKLTSWRQFLDAFGPPLAFAHTGEAVRLFFENGGAACYMIRVSDPDVARTASQVLSEDGLGGAFAVHAAYSAIGQPVTDGAGPTSEPGALPHESPGAWGNRLSVTVQPAGLGATESLANQPADGASLVVGSIAGFEVGSLVRLVQDANVRAAYGLVAEIDPQLREITWADPLDTLGLDFARPIRLETVEVTLLVSLDGQVVERHANLSLNPDHSRFARFVLEADSAILSASVTVDAGALSDPKLWPEPGSALGLTGGRNGLATVTRHDFIAALARFETVNEISVLAAPDVVLRAEAAVEEFAPLLPYEPCKSPDPLPQGVLSGQVFDAAEGVPLRGVRVTSRDVQTRAALTDGDGLFVLDGLPVGQVTLRLERAGYTTLDASAQAFLVQLPQPQRFEISPKVLPPALEIDEIFEVQQAMIAQGERGFYRMALLDPPEEMLAVDDIRSWRSRFDTTYAALYWPWLITTPTGGAGRMVPPSGAVAGLVARMDLAEGPQRAPANRPFRKIEALSRLVDDPTHALLNDLGINVIRAYPGRGIAPQGAWTVSSNPEWRLLNLRRLVLMIAKSLEDGFQWAVFEPNNRILRDALTHSLTAFLNALWRAGAFAGASPAAAFVVRCDDENNPQAVIDAGQVVAQIAIAPVHPYEFIRIRLGRTDRLQVQVEE